MLLEYLQINYEVNEPIFLSDIDLPVSGTNLRQMFKVLCDSGKIQRYDTGIYYIKGSSRLRGGTNISASEVARCKYISRKNRIEGYYSGYTFANQLGLTAQVPYTLEIVSNEASSKYREVNVKEQRIILRRPRTEVNRDNCNVLQLLDLLKDLDQYTDEDIDSVSERISFYVKKNNIKREDIDKYISLFPTKVYKSIYEARLYNVFV